MNMMMTSSRPGYIARMETDYIDTTDMCIELYYRSQAPNTTDKPVISVYYITEERVETVLVSSSGWEPDTWNRMFAVLPNEVVQIGIQGSRSWSASSSMSVDDVIVQPCNKFG